MEGKPLRSRFSFIFKQKCVTHTHAHTNIHTHTRTHTQTYTHKRARIAADLNPAQQQHHSIEIALKRMSEVRASVLDRFTLSTRCDDADEACTFLPRGFPLARRKGVNVEAAARVRVEPRTAVFNNFSVMMVEVPTKRNNFYESGILSYWIYFRSVR